MFGFESCGCINILNPAPPADSVRYCEIPKTSKKKINSRQCSSETKQDVAQYNSKNRQNLSKGNTFNGVSLNGTGIHWIQRMQGVW